MLLLKELKEHRTDFGFTVPPLCRATGIAEERYRLFELKSVGPKNRPTEPWLHEAVALARFFGFDRITKLLGPSDDLTTYYLGEELPHDLDVWVSGRPIALSTACRVALSLGFDDPIQLADPDLSVLRQIWSVVEAGERLPGVPGCPWCCADTGSGMPHSPTCLPNNLLRERAPRLAPNISSSATSAVLGRPARAGGIAHGVKALRERACRTQGQMGSIIGVSADAFSKIERGERNLIHDHAHKLANFFGIDRSELYRRP